MLKWFSDISTVLEQIHIFKTSVKAEVTLDVWLRQPESQPWTQLIHMAGSRLHHSPFRSMERKMLGSCLGNTLKHLQKSMTFQSSLILIFISKQSLSSQGLLLELASGSEKSYHFSVRRDFKNHFLQCFISQRKKRRLLMVSSSGQILGQIVI